MFPNDHANREFHPVVEQLPNEAALCAITQNPDTPIAVLEALVQNPPQIDPAQIDPDDLSAIAGAELVPLFTCIARNPNTPASLLVQITRSGVPLIGYLANALIEHPHTPIELLERFATGHGIRRETQQLLLQNPRTPATALEKLALTAPPELYPLLRTHPNTSQETLEILNFLENQPGTTVELLEKLATNLHDTIRLKVAKYQSTPDTVLAKLIDLSDREILRAIIAHPQVSATTLDTLVAGIATASNRWDLMNTGGIYDRLPQHPKITLTALNTLLHLDPSCRTDMPQE